MPSAITGIGSPLPAGGVIGGILVKNTATDYDTGWTSSTTIGATGLVNATGYQVGGAALNFSNLSGTASTAQGGVATGGSTVGGIYVKNSATNYDAGWTTGVTIGAGIVSATGYQVGGAAPTGQVLTGDGTKGVWKTKLAATFAPSDPAGTTSTTGLMMGMGSTVKFTLAAPTSGTVFIIAAGNVVNTAANGGSLVILYYGTGTAPANGAAPTGTQATAGARNNNSLAAGYTPWTQQIGIGGLVAGTQYWVDLRVQSLSSGTSGPGSVYVTVFEL